MSIPSPATLLAVLMLTRTALAQSELPGCESETLRVELAAGVSSPASEVCIRPGHATVWVFDAPLLPERMDLEDRERFQLVEAGRHGVLLVPSAALRTGERLKLSVRFADGLAPEGAHFILVVHSSRSIRQVDVSRRPARTGEELHRLAEENARLRGELSRTGSLARAHFSGALDERGISSHAINRRTTPMTDRGLQVSKAFGQRSARRVLVLMELKNLEPSRPWTARSAKLTTASGEELKVLAVSPPEPIRPGVTRRLAIEAEATTAQALGTYTLTVLEADGQRSLTVEGVTFPALELKP